MEIKINQIAMFKRGITPMKKILFFTLFIFTIQSLSAQYISVQGVLRDANNRSVEDGTYSMMFKIYDHRTLETGLVWESNQEEQINVLNGVYSHSLHIGENLQMGNYSEGEFWLAVKVDGDWMNDRVRLHLSPYETSEMTGTENHFPNSGKVGVGTGDDDTLLNEAFNVNGNVDITGSISVDNQIVVGDTIKALYFSGGFLIGETAIDNNAINSAHIINESITSSDIGSGAVGTSEVSDNSLTANDLAASSVGTSEVTDNSLTANDLAPGSVGESELGSDAVKGTKIANDQINSEHYVATSIDNEHLADDAVDSDEIATGAIDRDHLSFDSFYFTGLPTVICEGSQCHGYKMGYDNANDGETNGRECGANGSHISINKYAAQTGSDVIGWLDCDGINEGSSWKVVLAQESWGSNAFESLSMPCPTGCNYRVYMAGYSDNDTYTFIHQYSYGN